MKRLWLLTLDSTEAAEIIAFQLHMAELTAELVVAYFHLMPYVLEDADVLSSHVPRIGPVYAVNRGYLGWVPVEEDPMSTRKTKDADDLDARNQAITQRAARARRKREVQPPPIDNEPMPAPPDDE